MRPRAGATFCDRFFLVLTAALIGSVLECQAHAQLPTSEERLKVLTDPESRKKAIEKEPQRPPLEVFLSQVAPFDILPYMKAGHWSTLSLELRANQDEFAGTLQTAPVPMAGLPLELVYRRDARLARGQRTRLSQQVLLPVIPKEKELGLELLRPESIRPDIVWLASVKELEPRQMLVVVLTKGSSDSYAGWNRFQAMIPLSSERTDPLELERDRYYRLVLPLQSDKPPLSPHPLTWTTISHLVWDGMAPDTLNPSQQQAMVDWLHWGGQLILVGGAGPAFSLLKDSFLSPYLPGDPTGAHVLLGRGDLTPLSDAYPPPLVRTPQEAEQPPAWALDETVNPRSGRYRRPVPIDPKPNQPVYLAGLAPRPGASAISLGESGDRLVGVEWRVGRGRVLMLGLSLTDPAIASWPGLDTFVRRVVLRRPEERLAPPPYQRDVAGRYHFYTDLNAADLTWVRYLTRDLGVAPVRRRPQAGTAPPATPDNGLVLNPSASDVDETAPPPQGPYVSTVADWNDESELPKLSSERLEAASGIKVPKASFVLKVVLAYILALVPLNWLICRFVLGRRELAWVAVPILALGFAVAVERAAAYDLGYDFACDEIDVLEIHGGYPRALVTRFSSLYSTGRTRFNISFPNDPTALALPLASGQSVRGEDISTSVWQSYPVPALSDFLVQPRSLAMVRAEEMLTLEGAITLESEPAVRRIVNHTSLELRDAVLVDLSGPNGPQRETPLGTIRPGTSVRTSDRREEPGDEKPPAELGLDKFLTRLRRYSEDRPESKGEIRLVAWSPRPLPGQKVEPAPDRHRGFTAVVVHLTSGRPPEPSAPNYNVLAGGEDPRPELRVEPPMYAPPRRRAAGAGGVQGGGGLPSGRGNPGGGRR